jgi:hypothetical protein
MIMVFFLAVPDQDEIFMSDDEEEEEEDNIHNSQQSGTIKKIQFLYIVKK